MEEIKNKKFKIIRIHDEFPRMIHISIIDSNFDSNIHLYESPFANCQTFTIGHAYKLSFFDKEDIISLFEIIYELFKNKQMVIDVKDEYNKKVLDSINHIVRKKYSIKYKSTNGNKMNLNIIQFN